LVLNLKWTSAEANISKTVGVCNDNITLGTHELDDAAVLEPRKRARDRFKRKAKIVRDIETAHRQRQNPCGCRAVCHFNEKVSDTFERGLLSQEQQMSFGMLKTSARHPQERQYRRKIGLRRVFQTLPLYETQLR
jgi:hypothetical protein